MWILFLWELTNDVSSNQILSVIIEAEWTFHVQFVIFVSMEAMELIMLRNHVSLNILLS